MPLIKLVLNNIQVDLLIARIPTNFLAMNPNFYDGVIDNPNVAIPEKELRNVNGYRTALYFGKYM